VRQAQFSYRKLTLRLLKKQRSDSLLFGCSLTHFVKSDRLANNLHAHNPRYHPHEHADNHAWGIERRTIDQNIRDRTHRCNYHGQGGQDNYQPVQELRPTSMLAKLMMNILELKRAPQLVIDLVTTATNFAFEILLYNSAVEIKQEFTRNHSMTIFASQLHHADNHLSLYRRISHDHLRVGEFAFEFEHLYNEKKYE